MAGRLPCSHEGRPKSPIPRRLTPTQHNTSGPLDALLMDHGASNYLADLTYLESKGMIKEDTAVLCDWSLYPGSGDDPQAPSNHEAFMKHMESSGRGASGKTAVHNKDVFSVNTWSGAV